MKITKAIIPAAGLGTRFLPFTKAVPKELLPLLNIPAIQHIISEGIGSNITDFAIITSPDKIALAQHFDHSSPALANTLERTHKTNLLDSITTITDKAHIQFIDQPHPLGLGHAVLMAKDMIMNTGDTPDHAQTYFGILLPDDIIFGPQPALAQLSAIARTYHASVIAVQEVPREQVSSYGIVTIKKELTPGIVEIAGLVEKPAPEKAPSCLAVIGRYILSADIFSLLEKTEKGAGGEIQLTDAIDQLIKQGKRVIACTIRGDRYDIGSPLGWLQANIALGLENPAYAPHIKKMLTK